jgi:hypothetical protein
VTRHGLSTAKLKPQSEGGMCARGQFKRRRSQISSPTIREQLDQRAHSARYASSGHVLSVVWHCANDIVIARRLELMLLMSSFGPTRLASKMTRMFQNGETAWSDRISVSSRFPTLESEFQPSWTYP